MGFEDHLTKPIPGYTGKAQVLARPARWWKRLLSLIVDFLVFDLVVTTPFTPFLPILESFDITMTFSLQTYFIAFLIITLFLVYVMCAQYLVGQTVGMMLFDIHVVSEGSLWRYLVRNLYILPFFPFLILWIIDPLFLFTTGDRLTEKWSGTRTFEVLR